MTWTDPPPWWIPAATAAGAIAMTLLVAIVILDTWERRR